MTEFFLKFDLKIYILSNTDLEIQMILMFQAGLSGIQTYRSKGYKKYDIL